MKRVLILSVVFLALVVTSALLLNTLPREPFEVQIVGRGFCTTSILWGMSTLNRKLKK